MDADDVAWALGRDPATALGYLLACALASAVGGALYEWNVAYTVGEALPLGWEWVPFAALHLAVLGGVAAGTGYHAAGNRGYATGYAGAFVALYGPAYAVAPLNPGAGFPGPVTVYEAAAETAAISAVVGFMLATVGTVVGLALDRYGRSPSGTLLAGLGNAAAAPLPDGARPAAVAVALLVVLSGGIWAGMAPAAVDHLAPCADQSSNVAPALSADHADGVLRVTYDHDCGLQASAFVLEVGDRRLSWADAAPTVGPNETLASGATVAVSAPPNATVMVVYESGDYSTVLLHRENASEER